MDIKADLVVVGAGIAGLSAANRVAECGGRVVVLEKGDDDRYFCNSRIATGALNIAHTDPHADPAVLRQAIEIDTEGYASPAIADALAQQAARSMKWLRVEGVRLIRVTLHGKARWLLAPPRTMSAGLDWQGRGPDLALRTLGDNIKKRGGTLMLGTRALRLHMSGARCTGVSATRGGVAVDVDASCTLLADGGFQGNADLVRRFISPKPESLVQRNATTGQGDALRMAEAVGARLTDAYAFYGHLLSRDAMHDKGLWPYPTMDTLVGGAIMVDRAGQRFIDEGLGGIAHSNALARMDDPLCATAVFDQMIWDSAGKAEQAAPNPTLVTSGGTLISAPDLASLAAQIGVPAPNLADTIASYNRAITANAAEALTPPRTAGRMFGESRGSDKRVSLLPIATPPFYAIPLAAGLTYTMGGIEIDANARVMGRSGAPIAGLFAAGSCTGGVEGGPLGGYIGGYLKALGLGLIAAETVAATMHARAST